MLLILIMLIRFRKVFTLFATNKPIFCTANDCQERKRIKKSIGEKVVPLFYAITAVISVLTTLGILFTLITETFHFFGDVPFKEFFSGTTWYPFSDPGQYGILPLISGTLRITFTCHHCSRSNRVSCGYFFKRICNRSG